MIMTTEEPGIKYVDKSAIVCYKSSSRISAALQVRAHYTVSSR